MENIGNNSYTENKSTKSRKSKVTSKRKRRFGGVPFVESAKNMGPSDFLLIISTMILVVFGLIMVFSSSYYDSISRFKTPYHFLIRHGCWVVMGTAAFLCGAIVNYRWWKNIAPIVAIVGFVLLGLLFTPMGVPINNATRWLDLGLFTIMPGEIAKLCAILFTAWYLSEKEDRICKFLSGILPVVGLASIYAVMIYKQPNLSTAITVIGIVGCMMVVAGLPKFYTGAGLVIIGGAIFAFMQFGKDTYQYKRFVSFLDPFADPLGDGYQVVQSLLGIGSGGLFGVGLGKSVQKNLYLPEPQNDFILAIIGEELGFIGIALLIIVYCIFIWRGVHTAIHAKDQFGLLMASGVTLMVAIQVILNVAVVTSSMPPTGINLPFISYGGNALIIFMFATGILVNVSRHNNARVKIEEERLQE